MTKPMEPDTPLLTLDLLDLRAEQRRDLRMVDDDLVIGADGHASLRYPLPEIGSDVRPDQRRLAEVYLRQRARDLRDEIKDELDRMASTMPAGALHAILTLSGQLRPPIANVLREAVEYFRSNDREVEPGRRKVVDRYIVLVALADVLADDGYRDPRLPVTE